MRLNSLRAGGVLAAAVLAGFCCARSAFAAEFAARPVLLERSVVMVHESSVEESFTPAKGRVPTKIEPLDDGWVAGGMREVPNGVDLFLMQALGSEVEELALPVSDGEPIRSWATPLVRDGSLRGLLWLEGERHDRLAVRAAAWTGAGWGPTTAVSTPGPGSQVAISGAVLGDGSSLAVWTLVDETGDAETVWSLGRDGAWSEPARIHEDNRMHDVQPILTRVEGGALVVWTAFDGSDYRLRRARFDGERWAVSGFFGGRGTGDMAFAGAADGSGPGARGPALLYSTVAPSTWSVESYDARGELIATGSLDRDPHDAGPVLLSRAPDGEPVLLWPSFAPEFAAREEAVDLVPVAAGDN